MNVAQETLDLRRGRLSLPLSLLMSAFSLLIPPANLSVHLHRLTERSPTTTVFTKPHCQEQPLTPFISTHVSILTPHTSSKPLASPSPAYSTLSFRDSVHQTTLPRTPPHSVQVFALRSRAKRCSQQCRLGEHCRPQLRSIA